jgi:hypothetical protein
LLSAHLERREVQRSHAPVEPGVCEAERFSSPAPFEGIRRVKHCQHRSRLYGEDGVCVAEQLIQATRRGGVRCTVRARVVRRGCCCQMLGERALCFLRVDLVLGRSHQVFTERLVVDAQRAIWPRAN